jgi:1-acyl-sn-glycerol-3-phosphate acyltransferase
MNDRHGRGRVLKPNPLFVPLVRYIVLRFLRRRYRLSAIGTRALAGLKPPYIVVANHVNFWDPFWINAYLPHTIQYVTSENIFRTFLTRLAMRLLGSIPKAKAVNDADSVRDILRVIHAGGVVGTFPEGSRTFDGRSTPHLLAVSKLIHKVKVPVVAVRIRGGYLARPRWARDARIGKVDLEYELLFTAESLGRLSLQEVHDRMDAALSVDEVAWQKRNMVRFRGKRPAEYIERLLFICPHCRSVSTMMSRNRKVVCTTCGYAVTIDDFGFFEPSRAPRYFHDPAEWNAWQLPVFREHLAHRQSSREPLLTARPAFLMKGRHARRLQKMQEGAAILYADRIEFSGGKAPNEVFPMDLIRGANVQNREKFEFHCSGTLYRLDFMNPRASSYQWTLAVETLQSLRADLRKRGQASIDGARQGTEADAARHGSSRIATART